MILLVHLLFGAAVGSAVSNIYLGIILAFLSHYFLDLFPHIEYNIEIKDKKQWKDKLWVIFKIAIDFFTGILLIFLFSKNQPINYVYAFFAILPDGLTILNNHLPNKFLRWHQSLHTKNIHFLKYKKISNFWRVATQIITTVVSIFLLRF